MNVKQIYKSLLNDRKWSFELLFPRKTPLFLFTLLCFALFTIYKSIYFLFGLAFTIIIISTVPIFIKCFDSVSFKNLNQAS